MRGRVLIYVLTIPSTGTHFVRDHLLQGQTDVYCRHIWPDNPEEWAKPIVEKSDRIIVPLRHPYEVAKSWARRPDRGLPLADLRLWWRTLVHQVDPLRPHYLPLDTRERDFYLQDINRDLGLRLKTDWPIVREADGTDGSAYDDVLLEGPDLVLACDIIADRELLPFFARFWPR